MKKYVSLLLVIMTIFTFVSCSGKKEDSSVPPAASSTSYDEIKKEEAKVYGSNSPFERS